MKKRTKNLVLGALVAALYVVMTILASALGLSSQVIQVRFSEALTILPVFTPAAIPGLFIGCMIANYITGCVIWDILFGSVATLIGAVGTYLFRKNKYLAVLPPILSNTIAVPFILKYAYQLEDAMWFMFITVGAGELISVGILGLLLHQAIEKTKISGIFE
ncbi:MAG TPA: QueT transporter family protein [Bacillota bacterium]|nr:QueT transporter family protein [Bacillota bacterium]HOK68289.1 QueT transporter family protein [Bacillota bacterium]HPP84503.1 QueT transporter family protein [Bacillota bacterium]